jgi:hypothetical protein
MLQSTLGFDVLRQVNPCGGAGSYDAPRIAIALGSVGRLAHRRPPLATCISYSADDITLIVIDVAQSPRKCPFRDRGNHSGVVLTITSVFSADREIPGFQLIAKSITDTDYYRKVGLCLPMSLGSRGRKTEFSYK